MIKLVIAFFIASGLIFNSAPLYAADAAGKDTAFDEFNDWVATIGKTESEKRRILAQRKKERANKRWNEGVKKRRIESNKRKLNKTVKKAQNAQKNQAKNFKKIQRKLKAGGPKKKNYIS